MKSHGACSLLLLLAPCLVIASNEVAIYNEQKALAVLPEKQLSIIPPKKCNEARRVYESDPEEQTTFISWDTASFPVFIAFPDVFRNLMAFGNGITLAFPRGMNLRDDAPEIGWTSVVPVSKAHPAHFMSLSFLPSSSSDSTKD
eukprot:jgi/Botrbrau1/22203/Bobra.168_1s0034.1